MSATLASLLKELALEREEGVSVGAVAALLGASPRGFYCRFARGIQ
jgi:hypothetical protein